MSAPRRKATYDDLCAVPEPLVAEIVDGELFASPRPAIRHALATSALGSQLFEPELHFGADVLVPDVAGWRRSRMPALPDVVGVTLAPDWVCEVVSPTTGMLDRRRKMPIYTRELVPHLWLVDPIARTLEVHRLEHGQWVLAGTHGGGERAHVVPFDAVELELARWWPEP